MHKYKNIILILNFNNIKHIKYNNYKNRNIKHDFKKVFSKA